MEILTKGMNVALKNAQGAALEIARVGLGWDMKDGHGVDVDSSMLCLKGGRYDDGGKVLGNTNALLYYGCLTLPGLVHSGDNLTGAGEGDDETITINFAQLPVECTSVLSIVNIYDGAANFGSVKNVKTNIYEGTVPAPIASYDLTEDNSGKNAVIVGEFYKHDGAWKYRAIGEALTGHLSDVIHRWE